MESKFWKLKQTYLQERLGDASHVLQLKQIIEQDLDKREQHFQKNLVISKDKDLIEYSNTELNNIKNIRLELKDKTDVDYVTNYILKFMNITDFILDKSYQQYVLEEGSFYYFNHLCMIKLSDIFRIVIILIQL